MSEFGALATIRHNDYDCPHRVAIGWYNGAIYARVLDGSSEWEPTSDRCAAKDALDTIGSLWSDVVWDLQWDVDACARFAGDHG